MASTLFARRSIERGVEAAEDALEMLDRGDVMAALESVAEAKLLLEKAERQLLNLM